MPQMKFTDTAISRLSVERTSWFTDPTTKGLQLCVTPTGVRTWYLNRWDATAGKTRRVKLGQFARTGAHTAWAKRQVGKAALDVDEGHARTREELAIERAGIPTFEEALEQFLAHRTAERPSGKAPMTEQVAHNYRGTFRRHLGTWADVAVDQLPVLAINQRLNTLQLSKPEAASTAAAVAGGVVRFVNKLCALNLPIPGLLDPTKHRSRVDTGRLDMSVPLSSRWADIQSVENDHKRLCLELTVYAGLRSRPVRELRWADVDLDQGAITLRRPIKKKAEDRTVGLSDDALRILGTLWDLRADDCDWVFPSRRVVGDVRGHLDAIDRFGSTTHGDLRHYWMTIARNAVPLHINRWLGLHTMTGDDLRMVGHYGQPTMQEQREGANAIAAAVNVQLRGGPQVVTLDGRRAAN